MFKKLIRRLINWANRDNINPDVAESSYSPRGYSNSINPSKAARSSNQSIDSTEVGFNFVIYNANGGKVIQCWHYDRTTDKQKSNLYLIHNEDDMATELSMIMTKESLSR